MDCTWLLGLELTIKIDPKAYTDHKVHFPNGSDFHTKSLHCTDIVVQFNWRSAFKVISGEIKHVSTHHYTDRSRVKEWFDSAR